MADVDLSRYKRIVQYFWDPEPSNLDSSNLPLWCLGRQYGHSYTSNCSSVPVRIDLHSPPGSRSETASEKRDSKQQPILTVTPAESVDGGADSSQAPNERAANTEDGGWPATFLDDFESRPWFSYRSGFPVIPRSEDPDASSSMSFSVRLRSQLSDQGGFTSDTGWGCMIRSGQSLLANSISILRLTRGAFNPI